MIVCVCVCARVHTRAENDLASLASVFAVTEQGAPALASWGAVGTELTLAMDGMGSGVFALHPRAYIRHMRLVERA